MTPLALVWWISSLALIADPGFESAARNRTGPYLHIYFAFALLNAGCSLQISYICMYTVEWLALSDGARGRLAARARKTALLALLLYSAPTCRSPSDVLYPHPVLPRRSQHHYISTSARPSATRLHRVAIGYQWRRSGGPSARTPRGRFPATAPGTAQQRRSAARRASAMAVLNLPVEILDNIVGQVGLPGSAAACEG